MPELPEAYTIARYLDKRLRNRSLQELCILRKDVIRKGAGTIRKELPGRTVKSIFAYGKIVVIELTDRRWLYFRLGMTGQLYLADTNRPVEKHTHLVACFRGNSNELRFRDTRRFGGIYFERFVDEPELAFHRNIGPDALAVSEGEFLQILGSSRAAVKSFLLDQKHLAGLGNIYIDESLFAARIHPLEPAGYLSSKRARALYRKMRKILIEAIRCGGSSINDYLQADGRPGNFQIRHRVYRRTGQRCHRCESVIERIVVSGRSTHFCSACQEPVETNPGN